MRRWLVIAFAAAACGGGGTPTTGVTPGAATTEPTRVVTSAPEPTRSGGTGLITFGTAYDPKTLEIAKPFTRFKRTYPAIAWSADLTRAVGATSITMVIVRRSAAGGEDTLISQEVRTTPTTTILANTLDLAAFVDNKPGTYTMRYVRSVEILAQGSFTLVE